MEYWILLFLSLLPLSFALKTLLHSTKKKKSSKLPPGPPSIPIIGSIIWPRGSFLDLESTIRRLCAEYGPIITLRIASHPAIFVRDRGLAHQALVQCGAALADRLPAKPHDRLLGSDQHNISTAVGPLWRLLRRNLTSEIVHPSRLKLFAGGRESVLRKLVDRLRAEAGTGDGVVTVVESLHHAMFCLLILMCFGEGLDEKAMGDIGNLMRDLLSRIISFSVFAVVPAITKVVFRKRWNTLLAIRRKQEEMFIPLIRARAELKEKKTSSGESIVHCYADSLLGLQLPDEGGRELTDGEVVSLCSEFLGGGTDTTATALQWILANLVRRQDIQARLVEEMEGVVGREAEGVREEELKRMPYLKAVILEGLRRHPPAHLVLPHAVAEEITVGGYVIPKGASMNFLVADMGWDGAVWEEPMEFRPERFMAGGSGEGVDITGSREMKMMPFGAGRRICPGLGLAMMHLEYFLANLVWEFEWRAVEGDDVDLTEMMRLTVVMKNPLRARISPRRNK